MKGLFGRVCTPGFPGITCGCYLCYSGMYPKSMYTLLSVSAFLAKSYPVCSANVFRDEFLFLFFVVDFFSFGRIPYEYNIPEGGLSTRNLLRRRTSTRSRVK